MIPTKIFKIGAETGSFFFQTPITRIKVSIWSRSLYLRPNTRKWRFFRGFACLLLLAQTGLMNGCYLHKFFTDDPDNDTPTNSYIVLGDFLIAFFALSLQIFFLLVRGTEEATVIVANKSLAYYSKIVRYFRRARRGVVGVGSISFKWRAILVGLKVIRWITKALYIILPVTSLLPQFREFSINYYFYLGGGLSPIWWPILVIYLANISFHLYSLATIFFGNWGVLYMALYLGHESTRILRKEMEKVSYHVGRRRLLLALYRQMEISLAVLQANYGSRIIPYTLFVTVVLNSFLAAFFIKHIASVDLFSIFLMEAFGVLMVVIKVGIVTIEALKTESISFIRAYGESVERYPHRMAALTRREARPLRPLVGKVHIFYEIGNDLYVQLIALIQDNAITLIFSY